MNATATRRSLFGAAAIAAGISAPVLASVAAPGADAELIAAGNRIAAIEQQELALYEAMDKAHATDKQIDAAIAPLRTERTALIERIEAMSGAATPQGLRALALASLALAPRNVDGTPYFDGSDAELLAYEIVRRLAEGYVA